MSTLFSHLRVVLATLAICVAGYGGLILGLGRGLTPDTAHGSLITRTDGEVIGSRLIAQPFSQPRYFWPRPSAVDYDAAGAGGSNLAPTSPVLAARVAPALETLGATPGRPAPADLVTASGSGLDPHISREGALFQAPRVAAARRIEVTAVRQLVERMAFSPGSILTDGRIINVLELNLALDRLDPSD